jgi:hypothetical protein
MHPLRSNLGLFVSCCLVRRGRLCARFLPEPMRSDKDVFPSETASLVGPSRSIQPHPGRDLNTRPIETEPHFSLAYAQGVQRTSAET